MSKRKTGLGKGTILDDFGNIVKLPDGAVEVDPKTGTIRAYKPLDSSRIVERNAGCFNCLHYDRGIAADVVVARAFKRDVNVLQTDHTGPDGRKRRAIPRKAALIKADVTRKGLVKGISLGIIGICTGDGVRVDASGNDLPVGDFVTQGHLCRKWSGVAGASLARQAGEPLSDLVREEYDKRGENPDAYPTSEEDKDQEP